MEEEQEETMIAIAAIADAVATGCGATHQVGFKSLLLFG